MKLMYFFKKSIIYESKIYKLIQSYTRKKQDFL